MYYWQATLKDGVIKKETQNQDESRELWKEIQPLVLSLKLVCDDMVLELPYNQFAYSQGKGGSANINGGDFQVESHWISCLLHTGQTLKLRIFTKEKRIITEIS